MNAYNELLSKTIIIPIDDTKQLNDLLYLTDCDVIELPQKVKNNRKFTIVPHINNSEVIEFISNIKFASIEYIDDENNKNITINLPSKRTFEDEFNFLEKLKEIDYDNGFGIQYLYGVIVFKDNSWLSRYEYDGSEHWMRNKVPEEKDYIIKKEL